MPVEERTSRADRCSQHPGAASVGTCDGCGRALCVACAVPVRGLVLGSECLAQVLGDEPFTEEPVAGRRSATVRVAFAVAALATLPPWTTLGEGSGPFGAWSTSPRWSLLAALAAVVGALADVVERRLRIPTRAREIADVVLGGAVVAGSLLAFFRPPFPAGSLATPWITAVAGTVAVVAAVSHLHRRTERHS